MGKELQPLLAARVKKSIDKLMAYHALGRRCDLEREKATLRGKNLTLSEFAAAEGVHLSTLVKARDFARKYNDRELKEFCDLRRKNGMPLNWAYVPALLTVPSVKRKDRKLRAELQAEAVRKENDWTAPELYAVIKNRFPDKRRWTKGGRHRRKNKRLDALIPQIIGLLTDLEKSIEDISKGQRERIAETSKWLQSILRKTAKMQ